MNRRLHAVCLLSITSLSFSGCAKYVTKPLQKLHTPNKEAVWVSAKALSNDECQTHFSRNFTHKGFQPIQLCISNMSNDVYVFDAKNIDLTIEPRSAVAKRFKINSTHRAMSWLIPGLFFGIFLIPAAVEGSKSSRANQRLDYDFDQRVLSNDSVIIIPAKTTMNKVLFVIHENYQPSFTLMLKNRDSKELQAFDVNVI